MPHDYSLGVWSEKEPVAISTKTTQNSRDEFPVFEPEPSVKVPTDFPDWTKPASDYISEWRTDRQDGIEFNDQAAFEQETAFIAHSIKAISE